MASPTRLSLRPFDEVAALPVTVDAIPSGARGVHESVMRAWNIMEAVKILVEHGADTAFIGWAIREMERPRG